MSKKLEKLKELRNDLNMVVSFEEELNHEYTNLFVANHNLLKDIVYLPMALDCDIVSMISPRLLYKNDLNRQKFVNKYLYGLPVEAHGGAKYVDICLRMGSILLQNGVSIGIFPEGAYIEENEIHKGRTGAVRMLFSALENNSKINLVPVAIDVKKDKLDEYSFSKDKVDVKVLKPIDYTSEYNIYSKTNDRDERNLCLHSVIDKAMNNISVSICKPYIDTYIELFKKNNVMFSNGGIVATEDAQRPQYLELYEKDIFTKTMQYIKELKNN